MSALLRNPAITALLARYKREMREYDARPQQYKPRWQITPAGEALLLHRSIEKLNPMRHERLVIDVDDVDVLDVLDDVDVDVDGGEA
ncbi:MAG: hypothetical protein M0Z50_09275 [Planctomycetia bacterium]|jgi:hypothetical protein|nr:hypothetical protein [Planctomycetia bacterium]